jgi:hypothetical protein
VTKLNGNTATQNNLELNAQLIVYDNFAKLIPEDKDFCAIRYMNPDIDVIMGCGGKQDLTLCSADSQCKWYKGKTVAANNDITSTGGKLFETNFCHPANIDGIEKSLPVCVKELNKDTCETKGCVWSVGK